MTEGADTFRLERAAVRSSFDRASGSYESAARLQRTVADELLERLESFRAAPQVVLDLGAGTGRATAQLRRRFRGAQVIGLDLSLGMLTQARRHLKLWQRFARVCADAQRLPLRTGSVDLVFSSLMLQWCEPLDAALAEVRRVLRAGGLFLFSTLGPATLQELRAAWAAADGYNHVNHFLDVHDVGSALMRAGLAEPVLDVDHHELRYPDTLTLMRDLKALGAHNVTAGRPRTLLGRQHLQRMQAAYEPLRQAGTLPSTWEVIYGVCFGTGPQRPAPAGGGEVRIDPRAIGRRAR